MKYKWFYYQQIFVLLQYMYQLNDEDMITRLYNSDKIFIKCFYELY